MEPESLLNCQKCGYRKSILGHLHNAEVALSDAIFDAIISHGPESDVTLGMRDARIAVGALWGRIFGEGMRCEGDEKLACPLDDNGHIQWEPTP